jgi:20S proteasome alpha/beta subunit
MFRNNYDNDSVTFSPQGRIFQVEYASEAVKQGSVVVGLVSKTHAVLAAIKVHQMQAEINADANKLKEECRGTLVLPEKDHPN